MVRRRYGGRIVSALGDTVGNFRAVGAAAARLFADLLDGPEPCGHDYDVPVVDLDAIKIGPVECPKRHYPKWLTDALDEMFDALAAVAGLGLTGQQVIWYGDPERTGNYSFEPFTESSRAEGTQRAQTPGEESGNPSTPPSPGDYPYPSPAELDELSDCTFLNAAAAGLDRGAANAPRVFDRMHMFNLADAARDRAAQFEVAESDPELSIGHEDLAAHISASLHRAITACLDTPLGIPTRTPSSPEVADTLASDLLADYRITPK